MKKLRKKRKLGTPLQGREASLKEEESLRGPGGGEKEIPIKQVQCVI